MTPEAQQIAIAEACGWEWRTHDKASGMAWLVRSASVLHEGWMRMKTPIQHSVMGSLVGLPDYLSDLNACAEMENHVVQAGGTYTAYVSELQRLTEHNEWRATAAQRCEAFLKACNLWTKE